MKKVLLCSLLAAASVFAQQYQAKDARVETNSSVSDPTQVAALISNAAAAGGQYASIREGRVYFDINIATAGVYDVWVSYFNDDTSPKPQNVSVGTTIETVPFPVNGNLNFEKVKALSSVNLTAGSHTVGIGKGIGGNQSHGWINIDYIEIAAFESTPFSISTSLVTPNASANANKVYSFMRENFQKKIISGVMTNEVLVGNNPITLNDQKEVAFIRQASGKTPALVGFDFFHGTGHKSDEQWFKNYNSSTMSLAEELFERNGIPTFSWHWKDPNKRLVAGENENMLFYTNTHPGYSEGTSFNFAKAFTNESRTTWDTNSDEYKGIMEDIDVVADYLKQLADKGVPVLWRPLHEAAGAFFWWGMAGPNALTTLWKTMFDRMVNHHGLDNLIWVWTCEEGRHGEDPLEWYPGDEYVDIIGRDYYYYNVPTKNHSSLISSFSKLKDIYSGRKMIALSEHGAIPYPENLIADKAGWSYFAPWYGQHTGVDGSTAHNTANDWNLIMNHDYVLTLEDMPVWANYTTPIQSNAPKNTQHFDIRTVDFSKAKIYDMHGKRVKANSFAELKNGVYIVRVDGIAKKIAVDKR
ncbi:MAG: hypothetical protein LBU89_14535 [Fibromonadaceae bacterium]|jgi:mannan endo-1,4-beta-mannosidase|nr:hypothetical protein [Fibromonadaceae bacterium]